MRTVTEMYEELISRLKNLAMLTTENGDSEIRISAEAVHAIREIATEAADAIEELLQKEKFHAFLCNVINPNDMQLYLEMYHSGDEKEKTE